MTFKSFKATFTKTPIKWQQDEVGVLSVCFHQFVIEGGQVGKYTCNQFVIKPCLTVKNWQKSQNCAMCCKILKYKYKKQFTLATHNQNFRSETEVIF